jgi:choline dehydrogenase-like flavoprotein
VALSSRTPARCPHSIIVHWGSLPPSDPCRWPHAGRSEGAQRLVGVGAFVGPLDIDPARPAGSEIVGCRLVADETCVVRHFDLARIFGLGAAERELCGVRSEMTRGTKFGSEPRSVAQRLARLQETAWALTGTSGTAMGFPFADGSPSRETFIAPRAYRMPVAGGLHQWDTMRMSSDPATGVGLCLHDVQNLCSASTAGLPTSSQATSTFAAILLAIRLADQLCTAGSGGG